MLQITPSSKKGFASHPLFTPRHRRRRVGSVVSRRRSAVPSSVPARLTRATPSGLHLAAESRWKWRY
eukprot:scaffold2141_cov282-Pinguiococcus_pyrenoidosus.AAC.38